MNLSNYNIERQIGEGGMAKVYLAHDNKNDTKVAVKVLNKEYLYNENIRKRFVAEARNLSRMNHSNIVTVSELIDEPDIVAFVMEYIEGETLKQFLERKGELSDNEIKEIFGQMLEAVAYVHDCKLIHRDIKPSNFLFDGNYRLKLLDFGIAKNLNANSPEYTMTHYDQIMGTVMYMSPEQIKSTKEVTFATDVYSLGVILWQMASGRKPYDSKELSIPEIQVDILKNDLPALPSKWNDIIRVATHKDSSKRFKDISHFQKYIKEFPSSIESLQPEYNSEITKVEGLGLSSKVDETVIETANFRDISSPGRQSENPVDIVFNYLKGDELFEDKDWNVLYETLSAQFLSTSRILAYIDKNWPKGTPERAKLFNAHRASEDFFNDFIKFVYERNKIKQGLQFIPLSYRIMGYRLKLLTKDEIFKNTWFGK